MARQNSYIVLLLVGVLISGTAAYGQQKVEGKVIDRETGQPVPFASIGIAGTSLGTSSNLDGEFSLILPESATLKVTCVGYVTALVSKVEDMKLIQLTPYTVQLNEIVITNKSINARRIVQKAFAGINRNYDTRSFLQKFFYRHYCKDDSVYGRLIEAFVDVWKHQGYRPVRTAAGQKEEMRVTHLRRSLDNTITAQGHTPISIKSILQADVLAYQMLEKSEYLKFYNEISNLRADFESYSFKFDGITAFEGSDVYKISYSFKTDSILTTSGYIPAPAASGMLYINTANYALVKIEDIKTEGKNILRTSAYYRNHNGNYYPYHLIREGEIYFSEKSSHTFHIELMSFDIRSAENVPFTGKEPGKEELLRIPYDSTFWNTHTILKTTPLEESIIRDLGKGLSLSKQFELYTQYEWSISDGGNRAEEKLNWFTAFNRNKRFLYLCFWDNPCDLACVAELEHAKKLQKLYRTHLTVVMISLDNDEKRWQEMVTRYNLFADGIANYRTGKDSDLTRQYKIKNTPDFVLLNKNGEVHNLPYKTPGELLMQKDFTRLVEQ